MKIPFGPYEDTEVKDLPVSYCEKLLTKIDIRDKRLRAELEERIKIPNIKDEENE